MKTEDGQVVPLAALLLTALAAGCMALLGVVHSALMEESVAQTAADAAALAGAAGGRSDAEMAAEANGGELVEWSVEGADALVVVQVGDATAEARARRAGTLAKSR